VKTDEYDCRKLKQWLEWCCDESESTEHSNWSKEKTKSALQSL